MGGATPSLKCPGATIAPIVFKMSGEALRWVEFWTPEE